MKFYEALPLMMEQGKKVKRRHWGGYWFIGFAEVREPITHTKRYNIELTEMIIARLKDGGYAPATAYQEDLLADDWEVVE